MHWEQNHTQYRNTETNQSKKGKKEEESVRMEEEEKEKEEYPNSVINTGLLKGLGNKHFQKCFKNVQKRPRWLDVSGTNRILKS